MGDYAYNYWQDAEHVRGIWRRTSIDSYLEENPDWEIVIDLDVLSEAEGENWVWKGASGLYPDYNRFLVTLSRGGGDASVTREFDAVSKTFVEGGFFVPEAKASVSWKDENTVWIGTDFGEGSLTSSGYPRLVKEWNAGHRPECGQPGVRGFGGRRVGGSLQYAHPRGPVRYGVPDSCLLQGDLPSVPRGQADQAGHSRGCDPPRVCSRAR